MSAGLNLRLMNDTVIQRVNAVIAAGGWNDAGRVNLPVDVVDTPPVDQDDPIEPNMVGISLEDQRFWGGEIGSDLTDQNVVCVIDIIAESNPIGLHLVGDLTAEFKSNDMLHVYDLTQNPVPSEQLFYCDIENLFQEKAHISRDKSRQHWWVISFVLSRSVNASEL